MNNPVSVAVQPEELFVTSANTFIHLTSSRDKIEQHLIKQKARATLGSGQCRYRAPNGTMCAAGCLIRDEKFDPKMEGLTVSGLLKEYPDVFPEDISADEVAHWQSYHDGSVYVEGYGGFSFDYSYWLAGNENHHPSKLKDILANKFSKGESV